MLKEMVKRDQKMILKCERKLKGVCGLTTDHSSWGKNDYYYFYTAISKKLTLLFYYYYYFKSEGSMCVLKGTL